MLARLVNALCFWLLTGLAYVLFLAAILPPQIREYRRHRQTERDMEAVTRHLEQRVEANESKISLLDPENPDPLMVAKLAREMLNYKLEHGRDVPVRLVAPNEAQRGREGSSEEPSAPDGRGGLSRRLTDSAILRQFEGQRAQRVLLMAAAVAICMAFIFFGTVPTRKRSRPPLRAE